MTIYGKTVLVICLLADRVTVCRAISNGMVSRPHCTTILRSWCRDRLWHSQVPKGLLIVSELPRNAMGKVTKPAVIELFRA